MPRGARFRANPRIAPVRGIITTTTASPCPWFLHGDLFLHLVTE